MQENPELVEKLKFLRPRMYLWAWRILKDDYLAEDAVQEALLEFSDYFDKIRQSGAEPSIARRMVIKAADRIIRKDREVAGIPDIEQKPGSPELGWTLREIVQSLSEEEQELFRMRFEQKQTLESISESLGISWMQGRYKVRQLQARLRTSMERAGFGPADLEMCA
ncbi:MAG TPA: hypothetical protein DEA96_11355 [Leptospiraceae bacterium]|nr:hypothetical protein [Spirochaetaceae bacterium]HBS05556.1 hypothetical protein [Leptospiraceae bacterium]|tara:strand:- start:18286 stop:18783 length:498 start_codon:yes stop_codon:yes gene_type:complete